MNPSGEGSHLGPLNISTCDRLNGTQDSRKRKSGVEGQLLSGLIG